MTFLPRSHSLQTSIHYMKTIDKLVCKLFTKINLVLNTTQILIQFSTLTHDLGYHMLPVQLDIYLLKLSFFPSLRNEIPNIYK